jgi:uncharacterized glyoxalase superfamily metalloenzyme YdcJ
MDKIFTTSQTRKYFSQQVSKMFGGEVLEYNEFTKIVAESNHEFLLKNPTAQVDSEDRVLAEKHGAIRVGTPEEMRIVARIFNVMGMQPTAFYDMTQLPKGALPMIATAFRPIDDSINFSAFRMFCSMLHPNYITDDIAEPVNKILDTRRENNKKFSANLLELVFKFEQDGGLNEQDAKIFADEFVKSLRIDKQRIIDFDLYKKLRLKNDVFADIVCLGININHLTPRAYDITDAANKIAANGIELKDGGIEGPKIREDAVIIQLNQTSRKAPGEDLIVSNVPDILNNAGAFENYKNTAKRLNMNAGESAPEYLERIEAELKQKSILIIQHKARFGEIESRGVALTESGIEIYKQMLAEKRFTSEFPKTHNELFEQDLAYYTFEKTNKKIPEGLKDLKLLVAQEYIKIIPQTYDDFLAASAAGIFKSNMSTGVQGIDDNIKTDSTKNKILLENALGKKINNPHDLYAKNQQESLNKIFN